MEEKINEIAKYILQELPGLWFLNAKWRKIHARKMAQAIIDIYTDFERLRQPAPDVCPHCLQTVHYHNCPVIIGWQGDDVCTDAKHTGPFFTNADGNRECRACGEYW